MKEEERCPITIQYSVEEIQEIAESYFQTELTEKEIEDVSDNFYDTFPCEIHAAVQDAVEAVIDAREKTR